jgi:hypothetical protein
MISSLTGDGSLSVGISPISAEMSKSVENSRKNPKIFELSNYFSTFHEI